MAESDHAASYEPAAFQRTGLIAAVVAAMLVLAVVAMAVLYLIYRPVAPDGPIAVTRFDAPRLQTEPLAELEALETRQRARIGRTEWLDEGKSVLSIPIEAAMKAVATRGQQAFAPVAGDAGDPVEAAKEDRPADAVAPADRRPNPGAGAPRMMEVPQ